MTIHRFPERTLFAAKTTRTGVPDTLVEPRLVKDIDAPVQQLVLREIFLTDPVGRELLQEFEDLYGDRLEKFVPRLLPRKAAKQKRNHLHRSTRMPTP